uniref:Uncharacterized protein n=1 Tax=Romanomermis culicivorax TaxID=13658 RepID=A0A915J027_ROMCU
MYNKQEDYKNYKFLLNEDVHYCFLLKKTKLKVALRKFLVDKWCQQCQLIESNTKNINFGFQSHSNNTILPGSKQIKVTDNLLTWREAPKFFCIFSP